MKHVIKLFAAMSLVLFIAVSMNAQTATTVADKSETKKCDVTKCNPAACDLLVKAGLCTKEQAAKCKAATGSKTTQVAAASMEKVDGKLVSSTQPAKKASCSKTCVKTCSSKKLGKTE